MIFLYNAKVESSSCSKGGVHHAANCSDAGNIDVVEVEPSVIAIGRDHFGLVGTESKNVDGFCVVCADALAYMRDRCESSAPPYDLVVIDVSERPDEKSNDSSDSWETCDDDYDDDADDADARVKKRLFGSLHRVCRQSWGVYPGIKPIPTSALWLQKHAPRHDHLLRNRYGKHILAD